MIEFPLGLRHAIESGSCVLFIGAGIGEHLIDSEGKPAPDAITLAKELASNFSIETKGNYDLAKISQVVELRKGRTELESFIQKRLSGLEPDKDLQWLFSLRWKAIFTTNYDRGIQRAYELISEPKQKPVTISLTSEIVNFDPRFEIPIYHLHGALFGYTKPSIIITEDDYARFRERRKMIFELLKKEFATSTILYIGYSNRDPNWKIVLNEIISEFYPAQIPNSYRVTPNTDPINYEILKSKNIETIDASFKDFVEVAMLLQPEFKEDPNRINKLRSTIPADLLPAFEESPAAVTRLLSSWTYVNQAKFDDKSNIYDFLRGDRPNWALIGSRQHFERDIEEQIFDDLLDYATSSSKKPRTLIVLGSAGYGITTLLMVLATRLIEERAGAVFTLKPGRSVLEGDVEYASNLFPEGPFFFVDNAADHCATLKAIIHRLRDIKKPAMFILGDRINEWRQSQDKIMGKEYEIESLSDPEIYRLIDCLAKHKELNKLEPLRRKLQFAAIKKNHRKELLVALREATEGKGFDAIIEDEFRGIGNPLSKQLYLTVCGFYQHGAYIRDALLEQLLETPLPEMYDLTKDATAGIVIYECIDEGKGTYVARARHRTIATIVWERCGDLSESERIIQSAIGALNLNYPSDKKAFEQIYRSDRMVDRIRSLEGKISFFETACRKDPESAYVRQHYSRLLTRNDKIELALSQIEESLRIDSSIRVLHHTKGMILMKLALTIDSHDIARRRLAQSEESYRRGLSMYDKCEYCYQGLTQLYLGWAKRAPSPEEAAEYISRAEGAINDGLKKVRVRDSLWLESANIQEYLGDQPSHLIALETAVTVNPASIISRYLLGKYYRKSRRYQDAIDVLEYVINNHFDEFRSFVEYSVSMIHLNKTYKEAIAILNLSTLYGLSDPRFIATLGGMYFLDGNFSEAKKVFDESSRRNFTALEMNTIQFYPPDLSDTNIRLLKKGKVIKVKAGYALIESPGYPVFLCPGSKFGEIVMESGLNLTFNPVFTAKSPIALNPIIDKA